jgi:hypothetical protein
MNHKHNPITGRCDRCGAACTTCGTYAKPCDTQKDKLGRAERLIVNGRRAYNAAARAWKEAKQEWRAAQELAQVHCPHPTASKTFGYDLHLEYLCDVCGKTMDHDPQDE